MITGIHVSVIACTTGFMTIQCHFTPVSHSASGNQESTTGGVPESVSFTLYELFVLALMARTSTTLLVYESSQRSQLVCTRQTSLGKRCRSNAELPLVLRQPHASSTNESRTRTDSTTLTLHLARNPVTAPQFAKAWP